MKEIKTPYKCKSCDSQNIRFVEILKREWFPNKYDIAINRVPHITSRKDYFILCDSCGDTLVKGADLTEEINDVLFHSV